MNRMRLSAVLGGILLLTGCATFVPQKRVNLAPFAENAVSIVSEVEYGLTQSRSVYTRNYIDGPAVTRYTDEWIRVGRNLRGIVAYAVEVVTISQSEENDPEKAQELARYIEGLARPVMTSAPRPSFTSADLDRMLGKIRQQKKYLDALNAAQPGVDEVARVVADTLDDLKLSLEAAREEVALKIHEEHAAVLSYSGELRESQRRTFRSLFLVSHYRRGEAACMDSLLREDPALRAFMKTPDKPTLDDVKAIEDRLFFRLSTFQAVRGELAPELEQWGREMKELDDLVAAGRASVRKAGDAVAVWRRSHQVMAAGVTDPAAIDLFGIAKSAVKSVAPIP